jgi:hypothetical protein
LTYDGIVAADEPQQGLRQARASQVVTPQLAVFVIIDNLFVSQSGQMLGHIRLLHVQKFLDVGDALWSRSQFHQDR